MKSALTSMLLMMAPLLAVAQSPAGTPSPTAPANLNSANACSKEITIYIDLSGTMTEKDPQQTNRNRVPLNFIAETLGKFIASQNFLKPEDTVSVKYFGSIVQTQADKREDVAALLGRLASPDDWRSVVNGVRESDFKLFTNFERVFGDIQDRVNNSRNSRQIIFIASDFAEDQLNQPNVNNVGDRVAAFRRGLEILKPLLSSGAAQIIGIYAPKPIRPFDRQVSDTVIGDLQAVGIRLYQYNEDTTEASRTLQNFFTGSVTAAPSDGLGVRLGGDNRIGIQVRNPNCDSVDVTGLDFRGPASVQHIDLTSAITLVNAAREVRVDVDKLAGLWNQQVTVTPTLRAGSVARTAPSDPFWLGNWVRISQLSPYLYPWQSRDGSTLVVADITRSARGNTEISIAGIEPAGRARAFAIPEGVGEDQMVFSFSLTSAQLRQLSAPNLVATVTGNGAQIIANNAAGPSRPVPMAASVLVETGTWLAALQVTAWIVLAVMAIWISIQTFTEHGDTSYQNQFYLWLQRQADLVLPLLTSAALSFRFGEIPFIDHWVWLMILVRALLVGATYWWILGTFFALIGWRRIFQRRLSPGGVAVARRRQINAAIWLFSVALICFLAYTFYLQPSASPPSSARVIRGALR